MVVSGAWPMVHGPCTAHCPLPTACLEGLVKPMARGLASSMAQGRTRGLCSMVYSMAYALKHGQQTGVPVVLPPNAFWASAIVHAAAAVGATDGAEVGNALPPGVAQAVPHATLSVPVFDEQRPRQPRQPTCGPWPLAHGLWPMASGPWPTAHRMQHCLWHMWPAD